MRDYQEKMRAAWDELMEAWELLDAIPEDERDDEDRESLDAVNKAMTGIAFWCGKA